MHKQLIRPCMEYAYKEHVVTPMTISPSETSTTEQSPPNADENDLTYSSQIPFVLYLLVDKQDCDFCSEILKQPDILIKYRITFGHKVFFKKLSDIRLFCYNIPVFFSKSADCSACLIALI